MLAMIPVCRFVSSQADAGFYNNRRGPDGRSSDGRGPDGFDQDEPGPFGLFITDCAWLLQTRRRA